MPDNKSNDSSNNKADGESIKHFAVRPDPSTKPPTSRPKPESSNQQNATSSQDSSQNKDPKDTGS